jgi:hypothetical protein
MFDALDIRDFGASLSSSNNSPAINTALAMPQGPVYVPPGNWQCVDPILMRNKGGGLIGSRSSAGHNGIGYDTFIDDSRLVFTGTGTACITQADTSLKYNHGTIKDLAIVTEDGAAYDWVFDFYDLLGMTMSGIAIGQLYYSAGGGLRSRKVAPGNPNWVNRLSKFDFALVNGGTGRLMDITWTDSQITHGNFDSGRGVLYRGHGNVIFSALQFNRATAGHGALTLLREVDTDGIIVIDSCIFDANATDGLVINGSPGAPGSMYPIVVNGCGFHSVGATNDIKFIDGPASLSGVRIANCVGTVPGVAVGVNVNPGKWDVGYSNNWWASGWTPASRATTPTLSFGGSSADITYGPRSIKYDIKDNRCFFNVLLTLTSKGSAPGPAVISNLPKLAAEFSTVTVGRLNNMTALASSSIIAEVDGAGIALYQQGPTGAVPLTDAAFTNTSVIRISGSYALT